MRRANVALFVSRYIMHCQIYFRMREVRAVRDITSLSHRETEDIKTEDVPPDCQLQIGCNSHADALASC